MSKTPRNIACACLATVAVACGSNAGQTQQSTHSSAPLVVSAAGTIPNGMPSHLAVGLSENSGATWMEGSGVPWDVRYAYFTYGWADNWGYGSDNGSWGLGYMQESASEGFIPAVEYYCMNGEPG